MRTIPGVDHAAVVEAVGARAAAAGRDAGVVGTVTVIDDRPAVSTPATSPVVRALCEAHTAVTGQPARLGGVPGATDGTVITSRTGMPTVVYGPGGKWIAHQVDEFVEVAASSRPPRSTERPRCGSSPRPAGEPTARGA